MRLTALTASVLPMALAIASCAPNPEMQAQQLAKADAELAAQLEGLTPTGEESCIPGEATSTIIDSSRIVWREGTRGRAWVSTLDMGCGGMRDGDTLIIHRVGSQLCRMDTIQPVSAGSIPGPRCALGNFTRYEKPKG